ncbi:MAG TPA: ATP-dependent protease [Peptococcaceae bacterium]|nr:MAG: Peptidase S16, lon-like protein [Clostridia bacterium 41_269]HBT20785.1 ATP-dependent protease [Peptococcaceae bacterium]
MGNLKKIDADKIEKKKLSAEKLAAKCDPNVFEFSNTSEISPLSGGVIGQERAVKAMDFGLKVKQAGYNLFLTGPAGTGKTTYAETKVKEIAEKEETPGDLCYVYNFEQPDHPLSLELKSGQGPIFKSDMQELIQDLKSEIKSRFDSDDYEERRNQIIRKYDAQMSDLWYSMENMAKERGFSIQKTPTGIFTVPTDEEGKPMPKEEFLKLPEDIQKEINARAQEVQAEVNEILRKLRHVEKMMRTELKKLEQETGLYAAGYLINLMKDKYRDFPKVVNYLDQVLEDVIENLDDFRIEDEGQSGSEPMHRDQQQKFKRYEVNVLVDNGKTKGAPVVIERNPTYYNLMGRVEHKSSFGTMVTDFTLIKPGAVHLANGGYLIIQAADILANPGAWQALKRTLKTQKAWIENLGEQYSAIAFATLKPEPIDVKLKVIMIGNAYLYHLMYAYDEDFKKLFKVRVDFDYEMQRDKTRLEEYAAFVCRYCTENNLRHLEAPAMAKIIEYSSRLASDQEKLSARFHKITELLVEADYWAAQNGNEYITKLDVMKAIEEKIFRSNLVEEKIQEEIAKGSIILNVDGEAVGQVNGLAVLQMGDYAFGKPNRITARVHLGQRGIINIERETEMSGPIHSKGILILSGFLAGRYAKDKPLSLTASITFEQLYDGVEGDSASSAELYALLSELSGVPINQGIAVTGSVNQFGEIQPIGGVNEKIEGFYLTCKLKGLTGRQGVIIPKRNVKNLMLKDEVIDAVEKGKFHIWAIDTIDEGIEILTGVEAGERGPDGSYPEGTINWLVDKKLQQMAEDLRRFGEGEDEEEGEKEAAAAKESSIEMKL